MATLAPISAGKGKSSKKQKKSSTLARIGLIPAVKIGNILTAGLEKITGKKYGRAKTKELASTTFGKVLGTATLAAAAATAIAANPSAAAGAAKTIGKAGAQAAVRKPIQTLAIAGIVASGAAPTIAKTVFRAGKTGGEVITGEKSLNAETIKDVGKGLGIALGIGAVGTAAGFVGKKLLERDKDEVAMLDQELPAERLPAVAENQLAAASPATPETQEVVAGVPQKRRKSRSRAQQQKISQSVRVNVIQRNSAHRINKFIKNAVYA